MPDTHKYTKDEAESLIRAKQDIVLFLRLASLRIENETIHQPFKPQDGHVVIGWLRALAELYATGEDITGGAL